MQDVHVLYDTAVLGMAQLSTHRTGTVRATEELARALARTSGCDLRLMASDFQGAAQTYLDRWLPGSTLVHPSWQTAASRGWYRYAYPAKFMSNYAAGRSLATRAGQFAIKAALAPVRPVLRRVPARTLRQADLYHAPSGVVPTQLRHAVGASGRRLPIFLTIHDLIPLKHPEYFPATIAAQWRAAVASFSKERWYLCSSRSTRDDLLETGRCDPARVFVTPLAASQAYGPRHDGGAAIRAKYGLGNAPYLLSVGTLEPRKNLDTVLRTFLRLVQEGRRLPDDLKLVLVGVSGWMYQQIQQTYAAAGAARERIVFTGHVPEADLPLLYSEALAFVYLSFYEGFGLPVLEAMQCGLPVITSNTSSLPEIVGDAGLSQDPRDEEALTHHLEILCSDATLRAKLSRMALQRAETFSWQRCADLTLAAYREALTSA